MATKHQNQQGQQRKSAGDQTGKKKATLEAEVVEDQERQDELTMISRQKEEAAKDEEVDYTDEARKAGQTPPAPRTQSDDRVEAAVVDDGGETYDLEATIAELRSSEDPARQKLAEDYERLRREQDAQTIQQGYVEAGQAVRRIRPAFDIDQMTLGVGTEYNFKAGQWYKVPAHVADHLAEKDLLMH